MEVVFDSGSTYTYFAAQAYQATVSAVDLNNTTPPVDINLKNKTVN